MDDQYTLFRDLLFADQPLNVIVKIAGPQEMTVPDNPWHCFIQAAVAVKNEDLDEAIRHLRHILSLPVETRARLWAWRALRDLGQEPDPKTAYDPLGLVLEVPVMEGIDTLAIYQGGTARYLNFRGGAVIWDQPDREIQDAVAKMLEAASEIMGDLSPKIGNPPPDSDSAHLTVMTRAGNFSGLALYSSLNEGVGNFVSVFRQGGNMIKLLIERAKQGAGDSQAGETT